MPCTRFLSCGAHRRYGCGLARFRRVANARHGGPTLSRRSVPAAHKQARPLHEIATVMLRLLPPTCLFQGGGAKAKPRYRWSGRPPRGIMPACRTNSSFPPSIVVVDPVGLVPTFLGITHGMPREARRSVALRASVIAALILAGSALAGDWLLRTLSITMPAFRIAGGLLLFSIASEMVFGVRIERQTQQAEEALEERVRNIAAFPLAIPLMAGPGAITASVLLSGRADHDPRRIALLLGVIVVVTAACWLCFAIATPIAKVIGTTGNTVLQRLLGVLLAALAVQYVIDGGRAALGA